MASTKRKPARRGKKSPRKGKSTRGRQPVPALPPDVSLQRGFIEVATVGGQAFLWFAKLIVSVAVLGGIGYAVWSLRPLPAYSSDEVKVGSAFATTFHVENTSPWFPLAHLTIRCVVDGVDAPDMPSIGADVSQVPPRLEPGQQASFTCPFHAGDPEVAQRSSLYFRSSYDLPGYDRIRLHDNRGPFVINTRLLPPRWTPKAARD